MKKVGSVVCTVLGTFILLSVLLACLAATAPRLFGYEIYHIVSGSMEPEIPVGSAIYVDATPPEEMVEGDIIAFWQEDSVIAHRVVSNQVIEGKLVTKGDANDLEDISPADYQNVIGRVTHHFPYLGAMLVLFTSTVGKIYIIGFALCGAMFNILGSRIRHRAKIDKRVENYR